MQTTMNRADALAAIKTAAKVMRADHKNFVERIRKIEAADEILKVREDRDIIVVDTTEDNTVYYRVDRH